MKFTENLNELSGEKAVFADSPMNIGVENASHKVRSTQEIANSQPILITNIAKRLGVTSTQLQEREMINYLKNYFVRSTPNLETSSGRNEIDTSRGIER